MGFLPGQPHLTTSVVDTLWGGTGQPSVWPADEHNHAGLIRLETQRAIPSFDDNVALSAYNSRRETKAAKQNHNWILPQAGPWQWFTWREQETPVEASSRRWITCSPSSRNYSSHFTGGLLWLWPAAPRPGPGLSSLQPQESPKSKSPQPPTSPPTHTPRGGGGGAPICSLALCQLGAATNLLRLQYRAPSKPGGEEEATAGTSPLNFPPPPSASEGSSLDPGPARMKRRASPPFGPAPEGSQIQRAGRKCPG